MAYCFSNAISLYGRRFHLCMFCIRKSKEYSVPDFDRLKNLRNISCCSMNDTFIYFFALRFFFLHLSAHCFADTIALKSNSKSEKKKKRIQNEIFYLNEGRQAAHSRTHTITLFIFFFALNDNSYCSFVSHFLFFRSISLALALALLMFSRCFCFAFHNQHTKSKQNHCRNRLFGGVLNQRFHLENLACHYG